MSGSGCFPGEGQAREDVRDDVDPQKLHDVERKPQPQRHAREHDEDLGHVGRQEEVHRLADVPVGGAAAAQGLDQMFQVVALDDDIRHLARHVGTGFAHGNADVGRFQRGAVVDAVPGHGHDPPGGLQGLHDAQLVGRADPGVNVHVLGQRLQPLRVERGELGRVQDLERFFAAELELAGHGIGGGALVAGDHHRFDAGAVEDVDQLLDSLPHGVGHAGQPQPDHGRGFVDRLVQAEAVEGETEHPQAAAGHTVVFDVNLLPAAPR